MSSTRSRTRILLIEDDRSAAAALERLLRSEGYDVHVEPRGDLGLEKGLQEEFDVVVTDLRMPGISGLEVVRKLHEAKPRIPIVLVTAFGTTETAIEATKHGAFEYLIKPFEMPEFLAAIHRAAESARLMNTEVLLGEAPSGKEAIIGNSRAMQGIYKEIGRVAATTTTVLIRGETGTGKELVARAVFQHSSRSQQPFVAVNCAAIPENLLESELFGHERGAFTGAESRRIGRFEQAHGGTLFLDEIGDMSLFTQAKLLRVLQEKTIQRVGGREVIPVDVRILAATHRNLEEAIQQKQFREDLYYRLSALVIQLPPLRQRLEDLPDLARYFLGRFAEEVGVQNPAIQPQAVEWLQRQSWPGNVRQFSNVIRQALLEARGFPVAVSHLDAVSSRLVGQTATSASTGASLTAYMDELLNAAQRGETIDIHAKVLEAMERELFTRAFEKAGGNQAKASRWLNVSRQTMREKLQLFGLRSGGSTESQEDTSG